MQVVVARLRSLQNSPPASTVAAVVEDLIWAHALPSDGIEHLTVLLSDEGLDLYVFLRSDSASTALDRTRALMQRARNPLSRHSLALDPL
ncbi:hypothetical protein ACFU7Y_16875 [Kitasatospora sp. NPDC057542]|uniref:hypothetical protein n=1 Tax=Streptomycetaceae TaxID=2062 RepID=UPI001CCECAA4|nr:hypothetical protein [Streptomyces sp. LS1784]